MVGVPGKFKGCETCRRKRRKCGNERPFCKKCIARGGQCEGYDRARIFITGTVESRGKVAFRPRTQAAVRKVSRTHNAPRSRSPHVECSMLASAEGHAVSAEKRPSTETTPQVLSVEMEKGLLRNAGSAWGPSTAHQYAHLGVRCLTRVPSTNGRDGPARNNDLLYFEHRFIGDSVDKPESLIRSFGPAIFSHFLYHQFFSGVFRPLTVGNALLHRRITLMSEPEWSDSPWQFHPKDCLDRLLDTISAVPSLLDQIDRFDSLSTVSHREIWATLLWNDFAVIQKRLASWQQEVLSQEGIPSLTAPSTSTYGANIFSSRYLFTSSRCGIAFVYFRLVQLILCFEFENLRCLLWENPTLQPGTGDTPARQQSHSLIMEVCYCLNSVVDILQPEVLLAPIKIVLRCLRQSQAIGLEVSGVVTWVNGYLSQLLGSHGSILSTLQMQGWVEIAHL